MSPDVAALFDLQRSAGNASVTRRLARQVALADPYTSWTKAEIRPIQRELRRLRLYGSSIDGILGRDADQGLVEAFGGDEWRVHHPL